MLPRFARTDSLFGISFKFLTTQGLADAQHYIGMVEWFRGAPLKTPWPFSLRPMSPYLASLLPLDPLWGLALVGLVGGIIGVAAMFQICRDLGAGIEAATLATLTFALSFPMFYYPTIGIVDPITIGLSCVAVLTTIRKKYLLSAAVLTVAVYNKETALVALGFIVPWILIHGEGQSRIAWALLAALAGICTYWAAHTVLAPPVAKIGQWDIIDLERLMTNFYRPRFYITQVLAIGIQGAVVIAIWLRSFTWTWAYFIDPWKLGYGAAVALMVYSMQQGTMEGGTDGRFLWYGQVYTTAMLAKVIHQWQADRSRDQIEKA